MKDKIEYKLPTSPSVPLGSLGGYSMLIYGRKKIGKTSLASCFPKTLFLMFEPGGKALRIYQESMSSWYKFRKFVQLIKNDTTFQTIVIDTADFAYEDCLKYVCEKLGVDHPADAGYGKGWNAIKMEFVSQIKILMRSGKGVILISHQKEIDVEDRSGKTHRMKTNTLSSQGKEVVEGLVDIWVNFDYEGERRYLTILGSEDIDTGHRVDERFRYTDGTRIRRIPMGKSKDEGYKNLVDAFNNKLEKPKPQGEVKNVKPKSLGTKT